MTIKVGKQSFSTEFVERNIAFLYLCFSWFDERAKERNVNDITEMAEFMKALAVHSSGVIRGEISDETWFDSRLKGNA